MSSSLAISSADEFFESRSMYSKNQATAQSFLQNQDAPLGNNSRARKPQHQLDKKKDENDIEDMFGQNFDWQSPN